MVVDLSTYSCRALFSLLLPLRLQRLLGVKGTARRALPLGIFKARGLENGRGLCLLPLSLDLRRRFSSALVFDQDSGRTPILLALAVEGFRVLVSLFHNRQYRYVATAYSHIILIPELVRSRTCELVSRFQALPLVSRSEAHACAVILRFFPARGGISGSLPINCVWQ
jgi:hypothetical protein